MYQQKQIQVFEFSGMQMKMSCSQSSKMNQLQQDLLVKPFLHAPSIILVDDFDSLVRKSEEEYDLSTIALLSLVFKLFERVHETPNVTLILVASSLEGIDSKLLVSGKLDNEIFVPVPSEQVRAEILKIMLEEYNVGDELIEKIATVCILTWT